MARGRMFLVGVRVNARPRSKRGLGGKAPKVGLFYFDIAELNDF